MSAFIGGDAVEILIGVLIAVLVALLVARSLFTAITVLEYQRGLKFVNGKLVGVLGPGRHWLWRPTSEVRTIDTRESVMQVPGQELVTSDGVSVKLSLAVRYRIDDPTVAITKVEDYRSALYVLLQVRLREVVGVMSIDEVLERRGAIGAAVQEQTTEAVRELGIELISVDVKDLMFPGPLKKVFAQVTEARQQGLASLEKARGETAALRSLANAARLVEANPSLLHLRTLQQLAASSGNTLIVGLPQNSTPLPVARQPAEPQLSGPSEPQPEGE
jgi:regulator of protease activity HflC (stomatin/prohibitin superfamily)